VTVQRFSGRRSQRWRGQTYSQRAPTTHPTPADLSSDPVVTGQGPEQLMGPECPVFVLSLALPDEVRHVGVLGGVRVVEELVVDLCSLERVILNADQVIDDVIRKPPPTRSSGRYARQHGSQAAALPLSSATRRPPPSCLLPTVSTLRPGHAASHLEPRADDASHPRSVHRGPCRAMRRSANALRNRTTASRSTRSVTH
jgi:hypothetical protein